jgi:hypothetical protein
MHEKEVQLWQKKFVPFVLRSGATPQRSILCFRNCAGPFLSVYSVYSCYVAEPLRRVAFCGPLFIKVK